MATTMTDTRPTFSRLTEGSSKQSWRAAAPAVLVLIGFAALLVYLASALSSADQKGMAATRDAQQLREQQEGLTKRIAALQDENAVLRSPGRTTVILQPGKSDKSDTWAAVAWGELPDGKTFMRASGYGLQTLTNGENYHVWMLPKDGAPVDVGGLEVDPNGAGFTMAQELPPVDQGKSVELTIDEQNAKEPGKIVASADLPKLQPTKTAPQQPAPAQQPAEPAQAKSGSTSQQMHQGK